MMLAEWKPSNQAAKHQFVPHIGVNPPFKQAAGLRSIDQVEYADPRRLAGAQSTCAAIEHIAVQFDSNETVKRYVRTGFLVDEVYIPTLMMASRCASKVTGENVEVAKAIRAQVRRGGGWLGGGSTGSFTRSSAK
jgi:hypothetical protein